MSSGQRPPTVVRPAANITEHLQRSALGPPVRAMVSRVRAVSSRRSGSPAPAPPHLKQHLVVEHVKRFKPAAFVETGTYRGDTIAHVRNHVVSSVSIELDETLCALARQRFRRHPDVEILWGDSGALLADVLQTLTEPSALWLDGHYSGGVTADSGGDAPVLSEVAAALKCSVGHLISIDRARLFDGTDGYPALETVSSLIATHRPNKPMTVADDIIACYP